MEEQEAWKQIIEKQSKMLILKREIDVLKKKAVKELRELGYSHDKICGILGIGKINSIKYSKEQRRRSNRRRDNLIFTNK